MSDALTASFTKRFPGGAVVRGEFEQDANGHSVTVLFGPSGCGKTTVLRCLAGLLQPEAGEIRFGEETWFDARRGICLPPQRRGVGLVFQDYALFPHLSVEGNVGYGLRRLQAAERRRRCADALERFGLRDMAHRRPSELSGGQQQRVALARALACRPRLLLLDEPLSALDAALRVQLRGELRALLHACDIPVLLVTHDRDEVLALGDNLVVMNHGELVQSGRVLEVLNRPANAEVARIVGIETLQPGRIVGRDGDLVTVEVGSARLTALQPGFDADEVFVCIRGEDVIIQRETSGPSSARNCLRARVNAIHPGAPLLRVELDAGFPLLAFITRSAVDELALAAGETVQALVKAPAIHLVARGDGRVTP